MCNKFNVIAHHIPVIAILLGSSLGFAQSSGNIEVLETQFEPVGQGKNVVYVKVSNITNSDQVFALHMSSRSPDYGQGVGWGCPFFKTIKANDTRWTRFVFKIQGPITDSTSVRLGYYNPKSPSAYNFDEHFHRAKYTGDSLTRKTVDPAQSLSRIEREIVMKALVDIKNDIRNENHEAVWARFTSDYRNAEYHGKFVNLERAMDPDSLDSAFRWNKLEFLELKPEDVVKQDGRLLLAATRKEETWTITFDRVEGQWKVDWISGYTPWLVQQMTWRQRLLPSLEKESSEHFDLYYFKDSTAAVDIKSISQDREQAYRRILDFIDADPDLRVTYVLFQDERSKLRETGHQGKGFADGDTIVEVYNQETKLDPYHETVHVLTGHLGNPPALFNEGIAVYLAEELGADALLHLGGGRLSIHDHVKGLRKSARWIDLAELLSYDNIGSQGDMSTVAYTEAASFVKFLIETYGKSDFFKAYGILKNSNDKNVQQRNISNLQRVYGKTLQQLQAQWIDSLSR